MKRTILALALASAYMAKAKTDDAAPAAAGGAAPAAAGEKAEKRTVNKVYEFVADPKEGTKLAPQAKLIVAEVKKAGKISRADLVKALGANTEFKTRQPIERIVTYYQKDLEAAGCIKMAA